MRRSTSAHWITTLSMDILESDGAACLLCPIVVAGLSAGFLFELDGADGDGLVERLGHGVDGEGGDGSGSEGFHLYAGLCGGGGCSADADSFLDDRRFDVGVGEGQRMAHRDELGSTLGGLDSS